MLGSSSCPWSLQAADITGQPRRLQYDEGMRERDVPVLLWPFYAIWRLLTFVLQVVGRLITALLGLGLMAAGVAVAMTFVAAPVGIPLAAFGFLLVIRAIF